MRRALPPSLVPLASALLISLARAGDGPPVEGEGSGLYRACGLNCLAVILDWRGTPAPLAAIESQLRPQANGDSSVADIERAARSFGLEPASVRATIRQLAALPLPAIVHLRSRSAASDATHSVVVVGLARRGVLVLDAPQPLAYMPYDEFERVWSGVAVAFPRDQAGRDRVRAAFPIESGWVVGAPATLSALAVALIGLTLRPRRLRSSPEAALDRPLLPPAAPGSRILLIAGLTSSLLATAGGCARSPTPPHLALRSGTVDLGVQEAGSVPFTIPVRNSGDGPLLIFEARSTCACTVAEVPRTPIPAGQADAIRGRVTVNSGEGSAEVLLATNEPGGSARRIRLTWFGKHVLTLAPEVIDLRARRGESFERTVELSYPGGDPAKMRVDYLGVDGLPPGTTLTLVDNNPTALQVNPVLSRVSVAGRATFRLRTQAPDTLGDQSLRGLIRIKQHDVLYDLPLRISFHVDEGLSASPASLSFSGSTLESLAAAQRQVVVIADESLGDLAVVSKPDYLDAAIQPQGVDRAVVALRVGGAVAPGVHRGVVILRDAADRRVSVATAVQYLPETGSVADAPKP